MLLRQRPSAPLAPYVESLWYSARGALPHAPAQFIRRFEQAVGLTPKRFARVLRLGALLPQLVRCGPRDWAQIAAGAGYFDQSHLIRDFRQLAGMAPGAYAPVQADHPTHVALALRKNIQYGGHLGRLGCGPRGALPHEGVAMSQIHEVFPYLMVRDAKAAIDFYQRAFGATELFRLVEPSGASAMPNCNSAPPC